LIDRRHPSPFERLKVRAIDRGFGKGSAGMHGAFQPVLTREILAAVTGHLMQSPEMAEAFARCIPKAPAAKAGQQQGTGAISSAHESLSHLIQWRIDHS